MEEINFACPLCHTPSTAPVNRAGQMSRCWGCGKDIQIPMPADATTEPHKHAQVQSEPVRVKNARPVEAKGVLRAGWICFGFGMTLLLICFLIPFYSPLFLASFILSIIAIAQKRHRAGLTLLFSTIFIPAITAAIMWCILLGVTATELEKAIATTQQPIVLPEPLSTSTPAHPSVPAAPTQQKVAKKTPPPKTVIHRSTIPSQTVSLESLLSLLEQKAHGFQTADTSLDRDEVVKRIQNRTREALSDYALQFTATITDIRLKSDGIYRVSFSELEDGGLNKNISSHLRVNPASSINLKMDGDYARNAHPGQKITVRAKARLSTGIFHSPNFILDIWAKTHTQRIGSLSIQENTYTIHN